MDKLNEPFKLIGHSYQIADTGDYDGCFEITNGKFSIFTKDDEEEDLEPVVKALNDCGCDFYLDDSCQFENSLLKEENEILKAKAAMELQLPVLEFQNKVSDWLLKCFGEHISNDKIERNHRFLEESLELVQSIGCTKSEAHQLVEYVFNRPSGKTFQEIGGVMVTLAALCCANGFDMNDEGQKELKRVNLKIDKIREKQANKPKHSPLPEIENIYALNKNNRP